MKRHLIVKLADEHPDDYNIPHWVEFLTDKAKQFDRIFPAIDRLMEDADLPIWLTSEYDPAADDWDEDEIRIGLNRTYRLILRGQGEIPADLIENIRVLPSVDEVRAGQVTQVPMPALAGATSTTGASPSDLIYLANAKAMTRGDAGVSVAVVDTGVNLDHPELAGKIGKRFDFVDLSGIDTRNFIGKTHGLDDVPEDEVGHGTHVSGIICGAGLAMNEGVAPDCRLLAVRVLATMRSGDRLVGAGIVDNINNGIKWAVDNGADVINMSLGIRNEGGGLPHADVIRYALAKGTTVVAASGNDGSADRYYPGALPGVIAVGAVDNNGAVTNFTSYGANITVVAPGVNIYSSFAHEGYAYATGTSQASPFVSGAIALMKSFAKNRDRKLSTRQIVDILKRTSDRSDQRLRSQHAGYGVINLADAFKLLDYALN